LTYKGHHEQVFSAAISPDGKLAASGAGPWYYDGPDNQHRGELAMWEIGSGREILFQRGIAGRVFGVAFSPDGRFVAAASGHTQPVAEGELTLREVSTGRLLWARVVKDTNLLCVTFSPDGSRVAAGCGCANHAQGGANEACKLWETKSGTEIATLPGRPGGVTGIAFRPDGKAIVLSNYGVVQLWDVAGKKLVRDFAGLTEYVYSPTFTRGGGMLAASDLKSVAFWDVASGTLIRRLSNTYCYGMAMTPDGRQIVNVSQLGSMQLRDAETGEVAVSFLGHDAQVYQSVISPDGRQLLTASADGMVRVWDIDGGLFHNPDVELKGGGYRWVQGAVLTPDAHRVVTASRDNTVRIWDARGGLPLETFRGTDGQGDWMSVFWCLALSPDGRYIAAGHGNGTIRRWDIALGKELTPLRGHSDRVHSVAYSPDGKRIASGSADATIRIWDAETGRPLLVVCGYRRYVMALAFSADGSRLVSGGGDFEWRRSSELGEIACWNASTGAEIFARAVPADSILAVSFCPDGLHIVAGGADGKVRLLDPGNGQTIRLKGVRAGDILALRFSPDGSRLALTCENGVRIWESSSWDELLALRGPPLRGLAFDPAGQKLVTGDFRGMPVLFDATSLPGDSPGSPERRPAKLEAVDDAISPEAELRWRFARASHLASVHLTSDDPLFHDLRQARARAEEAVRLDPGNTQAQVILGTVCLADERPSDSVKAFNQAASVQPGDFTIRYHQLLALARAEDWPAARAVAAEMLARWKATDDPSLANMVAWACSLLPDAVSDREVPVRMAAQVIPRIPADKRHIVLNTLGAALVRADRPAEAIKKLKEGI